MKYNLIIDYSYLCYKSLYTITGLKRTEEEKFLDNDYDKCLLTKKILKDIQFVIDKAIELVSKENLESIVLCCDSKTNFRKRILPESYKQDRKKHRDEKTTINFDEYFKVISNVSDVLKNSSDIISVLKHDEFEADDLIYGMSSNNNYNLIYASDSDLEQTLSENTHMFKTYRDSKTIYVNESFKPKSDGFDDFLKKDDDFFDNFFSNKGVETIGDDFDLLKQCKTLDYKVEKINPLELVVCKIILGDTSDNIQSIFYGIDEGCVKKKCRKQFVKKILNKYLTKDDNSKYFDIRSKLEADMFFKFFVEHLITEKYIDVECGVSDKLLENLNVNYDLIVFSDNTYKKYCNETPSEYINNSEIKKFNVGGYRMEFENNDIFLKITDSLKVTDKDTIEQFTKVKDKENIVEIEFKI